jgi:hypothetical protein
VVWPSQWCFTLVIIIIIKNLYSYLIIVLLSLYLLYCTNPLFIAYGDADRIAASCFPTPQLYNGYALFTIVWLLGAFFSIFFTHRGQISLPFFNISIRYAYFTFRNDGHGLE